MTLLCIENLRRFTNFVILGRNRRMTLSLTRPCGYKTPSTISCSFTCFHQQPGRLIKRAAKTHQVLRQLAYLSSHGIDNNPLRIFLLCEFCLFSNLLFPRLDPQYRKLLVAGSCLKSVFMLDEPPTLWESHILPGRNT